MLSIVNQNKVLPSKWVVFYIIQLWRVTENNVSSCQCTQSGLTGQQK